jgi:hypothetical protein
MASYNLRVLRLVLLGFFVCAGCGSRVLPSGGDGRHGNHGAEGKPVVRRVGPVVDQLLACMNANCANP